VRSGQTPEGERLRQELHEEVDKQFRRFGIGPLGDLEAHRYKADDIIVNWLGQKTVGPPFKKRIEYVAVAVVSRLSKWTPEGGDLDDQIMPVLMKLFDEVVEAGVNERDLILFNQQIAELILSRPR